MSEKHFELSDVEFERQFTTCELDPAIFSHEAHLRLAWIYIFRYGREAAERKIQEQLKNFVASVGATDKYHVTLTVAAVRLVSHFMRQSEADNFRDFIGSFPALKTDFKGLIARHYSFDVLNSEVAKKAFVEPDICPFFERNGRTLPHRRMPSKPAPENQSRRHFST